MKRIHRANRKLLALAPVAICAAAAGSAAGVSAAGAQPSATGRASGPPQTVTATLITRPRGTLRPGARVRAANVGHRVFLNRREGFALANVVDAQYPAATADGGRTWRTDGPALHLNAAQAPLAVVFAGAASVRTLFAFGGGQVVDATGDAGRHWWRAFLADGVLAVVPRLGGGLLAVAQVASSTGTTAVNVVYVSSDGGHHWRRDDRFGT